MTASNSQNRMKDFLPYFLLAVPLLLSLLLFGSAGLRTFLGFMVVIFIPSYLFFGFVTKDPLERLILSLFIGLTLGSLLIWYVDRIFQSLRLSMIISTLLFYGAYFGTRRFLGARTRSQSANE